MGEIYQGEGPYEENEGTLYFKHLEVSARRAAFVLESRTPDEGNWALKGVASRDIESGPFRSGLLRYVCLDDGDLGYNTRLVIWIVPTLYGRGCAVKGYLNDFEGEEDEEINEWHFEFELERQGWRQSVGREQRMVSKKRSNNSWLLKSKKKRAPLWITWPRFFSSRKFPP